MPAHALLQVGFVAATSMAAPAMTGPDASAARFLTGTGGMSVAAMDDQGLLSVQSNLSLPGAPSWLAFRGPDKAVVVNENGKCLRVVRLSLDALKKSPNIIQDIQEGSAGIVHLAFSKDGRNLLGAGYTSAAVDVWSWDEASAVSPLKLLKTITIPTTSSSPNTERQSKPFPHQIIPDPSGRFYAVNDLGSDRIWLLDGQRDFAIVSNATVKPAGCGPRHGAFYPPGAEHATHYMVVCELSNVITLYSLTYHANTIRFTQKRSISTFRPKDSRAGEDGASPAAGELVLDAQGKDLYVSNRLTAADIDNIAHFTITKCPKGSSGLKLDHSESVSGGAKPRMFSLTLDGTRALVANELGPNVVMNRDAATGKLTPLGKGDIPIKTYAYPAGPQFIQQIR